MQRNRLLSSITHASLTLLVGLAMLLLLPAHAPAQTVLSRARIGGYAEDITFVPSGPLKDHIVIADGYEVYGVRIKNKDKGEPLVKLFDLRALAIDIRPNGITYIESEGLFAINDAFQPTKLFLVDHQGQPRGVRAIQYLNNYRPGHLEGLAYLPPNSPSFPDHLLMVTYDDQLGGPVRLQVMTRNGQVVAEISNPNWPAVFTGLGDVAFYAPNRLLVSVYDSDNTIWTMDFAGNILSGPLALPDGGEGIIQMSDGRIAATGFPQKLLFFDSDLNRQPQNDRNDIIGLNLNLPAGIAWNSDTNQHLILHDNFPNQAIAAVPPTLNSATHVASLGAGGFIRPRRMTYLPGEHLIAVAHANLPRAILLFNNDGTLNSQVDLAPLGLGNPVAITYIPTTNQFAVGFNNPNDPNEARKLRILSRAGALDRTVDLTCTGIRGFSGLAYFDPAHPSGGQFIILANAGRMVITDFDGNWLREFNSRVKLGLFTRVDIAAITTGPQAGAFSVVDNIGGEMVIFRLDQ